MAHKTQFIDSEPLLSDLCLMRTHIIHHKAALRAHRGHMLLFLLAAFWCFFQALDVLARKFIVI